MSWNHSAADRRRNATSSRMPVPASSISTVNATMADSAQTTARPKRAEEHRRHRLLAQGTDEHRKDSAAGRRSAHRTEDDGHIQRNRSAMQIFQQQVQSPLFRIISIVKRFRDCLDLVANAGQSCGEDIQEGGDPRQQEDWRQRHLDDVGDGVEGEPGVLKAEHVVDREVRRCEKLAAAAAHPTPCRR